MKIQLASDLHLEFPAAEMDIPNMGTDVLILGGDITTARYLATEAADSKVRKFFRTCSERFKHVIYFPGNHESYGWALDTVVATLQEHLADLPNVHVMDGDEIEIDGVPFFAGTLWTDCNGRDEKTLRAIRFGMNDYRLIQKHAGHSEPIWPVDTVAEHTATLAKLDTFLQRHKGEKVVLCTHHAPSKKSIHSRFKDDFHMNGGYQSDLTAIMRDNPNIVLWTHGHTHNSFDYMEHSTRIVCNPAGYQTKYLIGGNGKALLENPEFNPELIIEI